METTGEVGELKRTELPKTREIVKDSQVSEEQNPVSQDRRDHGGRWKEVRVF